MDCVISNVHTGILASIQHSLVLEEETVFLNSMEVIHTMDVVLPEVQSLLVKRTALVKYTVLNQLSMLDTNADTQVSPAQQPVGTVLLVVVGILPVSFQPS